MIPSKYDIFKVAERAGIRADDLQGDVILLDQSFAMKVRHRGYAVFRYYQSKYQPKATLTFVGRLRNI